MLLYRLGKLCVLKFKQLQLIREAHTSKVVRNFGVGKIVVNFLRYVFWPRMQEDVARFIRGCTPCYTSNLSNKKQGQNHHLLTRTCPWESISMNFVGCLPTIRKGDDFLFMVIERFNKMCVLMPCKNTIWG